VKIKSCVFCLIGAVICWAGPLPADVQFSNPTDTISVAGNTVLPNQGQVTYEAIIDPISTDYPPTTSQDQLGEIYTAWQYGAEDEHFFIGSDASLGAYTFPVNWPSPPQLVGGTFTFNTWYDIAYVYDGSEERLYIDGSLVASRPASPNPYWNATNGDIGYGTGSIVAIGAVDRDGGVASGFLGDIQTLRISDVARYFGNSYTPSMSDFTDDSSTILLYDFDQLSPGATSIDDLSGNGHTGTFGIGFDGATSPVVVVPEPASIGVIGLVGFGILGCRRGSGRRSG